MRLIEYPRSAFFAWCPDGFRVKDPMHKFDRMVGKLKSYATLWATLRRFKEEDNLVYSQLMIFESDRDARVELGRPDETNSLIVSAKVRPSPTGWPQDAEGFGMEILVRQNFTLGTESFRFLQAFLPTLPQRLEIQ